MNIFRAIDKNRRGIFLLKVVAFFKKKSARYEKLIFQNRNNCLTKNFFTIIYFQYNVYYFLG